MKKLKLLIVLLVCVFMPGMTAHAEEMTEDMGYVDSQKDIMITIHWEKEQPAITFISPSGKKINPLEESELYGTAVTKKSMYCLYKQAESGAWKISYDSTPDNQVTYRMEAYTTDLLIQEFQVGDIIGDQAAVKFMAADSDEYLYYNYKISAVTDQNGGELLICEGTARANDSVDVTVDLSALNSFDAYMLKLYVYCEKNGAEIFDQVYSDPFAYHSNNMQQTTQDFFVKINKKDYSAVISYNDLPYEVENTLVAMFIDDAQEPAQYDRYSNQQTSIDYMYDNTAKKLRFEFSYCVNGRYTEPKVRTIDLVNSPDITFPEEAVSSNANLSISYKQCTGNMASIYLKEGEEPQNVVLSGDGTFNISLQEDWNSLTIDYPVDDTITLEATYEVFIDRTAPVIRMYEDYTNMHTEEGKITFIGSVMDCDTITVGGNTADFDENGSFTVDYELSDGVNTVPIIASDVAGNKAVYTATITKGDAAVTETIKNDDSTEAMSTKVEKKPLLNGFLPLVIAGVIAVAAIIYALIFWKKKALQDNHHAGKGDQQ